MHKCKHLNVQAINVVAYKIRHHIRWIFSLFPSWVKAINRFQSIDHYMMLVLLSRRSLLKICLWTGSILVFHRLLVLFTFIVSCRKIILLCTPPSRHTLLLFSIQENIIFFKYCFISWSILFVLKACTHELILFKWMKGSIHSFWWENKLLKCIGPCLRWWWWCKSWWFHNN